MPDNLNFVLARILGNDLYPRHRKGQTLDNLKFILDNEYAFDDCSKIFILNRIVDPDEEKRIQDELSNRGYPFLNVPFLESEYLFAQNKAAYLTNVNSARNLLLKTIFPPDTVILPLDGNCFFRLDGWFRFVNSLEYDRGYAIIQMSRCLEYPDPTSSVTPTWYEDWKFSNKRVYAPSEPQIAFLPGFDKIYDESLMYSEASKLGLLYTIGYKGVWDNWYPELRAKCVLDKSKYFRRACEGGWCFRLPSGVSEAELNNQARAELRTQGLANLVDYANSRTSS
jgi:hypothetical protein